MADKNKKPRRMRVMESLSSSWSDGGDLCQRPEMRDPAVCGAWRHSLTPAVPFPSSFYSMFFCSLVVRVLFVAAFCSSSFLFFLLFFFFYLFLLSFRSSFFLFSSSFCLFLLSSSFVFLLFLPPPSLFYFPSVSSSFFLFLPLPSPSEEQGDMQIRE